MSFQTILEKYRNTAFSERDKGGRFERLMQAYLQTDPKYSNLFKNVWLWNEFPGKDGLGGSDSGIDLVALTVDNEYWAVQCKCYQESNSIDKPAVDSFLSTSSRQFISEDGSRAGFAHRLWISTTNKWGHNATLAISDQHPPVSRITITQLNEAPIDWQKLDSGVHGRFSRTEPKKIKDHQSKAVNSTHDHFKVSDRGKLIMACGTGKTFTSLRIAEKETDGSGLVLFLVPSIALLSQSLTAWFADAVEPITAICICSDPESTKKKSKHQDTDGYSVVDLALPASTDVKSIVKQLISARRKSSLGMTVVFSTYQSIDVISAAQKELMAKEDGYGAFDLIICDEAHRTTGVTLSGEESSAFTKVHDNDFINASKRLYMTATPRLYHDTAKSRAKEADAVLCSMDDANLFGDEIYRIGFGEAVGLGLLTDYKVLILTMNEADVPVSVQQSLANGSNEISTDDISKLIGCINALSKQILGDAGVITATDPDPMRRAVAFCQSIEHSKNITGSFNDATDVYRDTLTESKRRKMVKVASRHVDGTMPATTREELLGWLKESSNDPNESRILTNVRCLSEGVDVPSLDAVMFITARNSEVDVVQSVGRVMRLSEGKKYGYIIIPVVIPSNVDAKLAMDDNERYRVVWTVLNALRAHDDRFNATINKIDLNKQRPDQIIIGGAGGTDDDDTNGGSPGGNSSDGDNRQRVLPGRQLQFQFDELQGVFYAKLVDKVGDRVYWEKWAKEVAYIAEQQIARINSLITTDGEHQKAFSKFLSGLQKNINPGITQTQAVEMLSQHVITKPVFEALFEGYSFAQNNPISLNMQTMLELLESQSNEADLATLQKFYDSVRQKAQGIDNADGKQRIIIELYDKFFKTAFPKMAEQLGIVYTPIEVVDYMINSVNDILEKEFGRSVSDENVHILDPFTGTGTFITRLLQSGLIRQDDLERKYRKELHANEIVLLAYYIASVNIENAFHDATDDPDDGIGTDKYIPFEGIVLTDTFQLGETGAEDVLISEMFPQNTKRVNRQKKAPLRVIIGNPPYSVGQTSANDNAQNQKYPRLDFRIANTYAKETNATLKNSLYDSYIKAFRWSSDRLDSRNGGIIAFVSNGAWLDSNSSDGFRKCVEREFSSIYVFNLRGNQRTSGELSRKEGGKIFGAGSRTPIAITFLVKNPDVKTEKATIHYHDIGDYLNRDQKLETIRSFRSALSTTMPWQNLQPNEHGDWISLRNEGFEKFIPLGDKDDKTNRRTFFLPVYGRGIATSRDAWSYNSSAQSLSLNISGSIDFYNNHVGQFLDQKKTNPEIEVEKFIDLDKTKFAWDYAQRIDLQKGLKYTFDKHSITESIYRPYFKQHLYFNRHLLNRVYQMPKIFPTGQHKNLVICVSGAGASKDFSALITEFVPDVQVQFNGQCFPLYYYEETQSNSPLFVKSGEAEYTRKDAISDFILKQAQSQYGNNVTKEDIFYYVYGFLHSPQYRNTFEADLKKMLPRLPLAEKVTDFWTISKAGRHLAELHLNYETVDAYPGVKVSEPADANEDTYVVDKMRFHKKDQRDAIIYNNKITITNIPEKAYEYKVNGKSAIEWIIERYQVSIHKDSQIKNDPNDWAREHNQPRYILDLLLSIINVSMQTVEIIDSLPKDIEMS